jgi:hypothetical protein
LASLTDQINGAIAESQQNDSRILNTWHQPPVARTYISPTDSYEDQLGYDSPTVNLAPGAMRGMWQVNDQQQASVPSTVNTVSGNTKSNASAAIQGGLRQNPVAPASAWAAVPQVITNLAVTGPVIIQANVSVHSTVASDKVGFAIYRDGQPIGNRLVHTTPASASASTIVQLSATDSPPNGNHLYALYWSPGTGTLVATSNYRNLNVINLTPH